MRQHEASRTLVKSPPELWAECSDADSLARHLDGFGEIRITRLEPETAVAWEGELASGTVRLEPSGWGTKVILTAAPAGSEAETESVVGAEPEAEVEPEPMPPAEAESAPHAEPPPARQGEAEPVPAPHAPARPLEILWTRVKRWLMGPPVPEADLLVLHPVEPAEVSEAEAPAEVVAPAAEEVVEPAAEKVVAPAAEDNSETDAALVAALDSLGQAHHRPFSRA
jgi:hypothetical protein